MNPHPIYFCRSCSSLVYEPVIHEATHRLPVVTDSQVKVLPVPEGSIVWLHNVTLAGSGGADADPEFNLGGELAAVLRLQIDHDRYVVLCTEGEGIVDVLGPDELVARVRAALEGSD